MAQAIKICCLTTWYYISSEAKQQKNLKVYIIRLKSERSSNRNHASYIQQKKSN